MHAHNCFLVLSVTEYGTCTGVDKIIITAGRLSEAKEALALAQKDVEWATNKQACKTWQGSFHHAQQGCLCLLRLQSACSAPSACIRRDVGSLTATLGGPTRTFKSFQRCCSKARRRARWWQ